MGIKPYRQHQTVLRGSGRTQSQSGFVMLIYLRLANQLTNVLFSNSILTAKPWGDSLRVGRACVVLYEYVYVPMRPGPR